jgi:putative endonuclease
MYYIYLLRCNDNSLYCGQTNNIEKRIKDHNNPKNSTTKYTRSRRPVTLVYFEKCKTVSQALIREKQIKKLTKEKKEALILSVKKPKNMISPIPNHDRSN